MGVEVTYNKGLGLLYFIQKDFFKTVIISSGTTLPPNTTPPSFLCNPQVWDRTDGLSKQMCSNRFQNSLTDAHTHTHARIDSSASPVWSWQLPVELGEKMQEGPLFFIWGKKSWLLAQIALRLGYLRFSSASLFSQPFVMLGKNTDSKEMKYEKNMFLC